MKTGFQFLSSGFRNNVFLLVAGCWLLVILLCGCQDKPLYKDTRAMMGTFVEVTSEDNRSAGIVFQEVKRIEELLSKYDQDSEISRLNTNAGISASPETFYIIKKAKEFWQDTRGAFDITVGPLMDLWGFTQKEYALPKDADIKRTLDLVGSDKIILNSQNNMVKLAVRGMKLDLGAIAKGYALDAAVKKLKKAGINNCLINAGGDIYCLGKKGDRPWTVAVRNPYKQRFKEELKLIDTAINTSGGYEQYFIKNNKCYSHIFDPRTGYPAASGVISVTVTAPDCLTADALATAIFVLGKQKGRKLAAGFPQVTAKIYEEQELR